MRLCELFHAVWSGLIYSVHSSVWSGRLAHPTFRNVHLSWHQTLCRSHRTHWPLVPVIWRFVRWGTFLIIVKVTFAASSVSTRCNLIYSNCCPYIGGIPQPAHCWTNLSSRLPLWSRTVDNFYCHYFRHLVLHLSGGVLACFLDQPHGRAWLSSVWRCKIWVKLELFLYPSPRLSPFLSIISLFLSLSLSFFLSLSLSFFLSPSATLTNGNGSDKHASVLLCCGAWNPMNPITHCSTRMRCRLFRW